MNPQETRVIDPILTNVARGYKQASFVGKYLFPAVPVRVSGGQVIEFGKESFLRYNTRRARGAATRRVRFGYEGAPFALEGHRLEGQVAMEDQRDASIVPGIDLGRGAVHQVMRVQGQELEIQQATIATNAALYADDHKVALADEAQWSHDSSKPARQIEDAKEVVRGQIGIEPNTLLLSAKAFKALKQNESLVEKIKYTSRDSITTEILAQLLDVERVVVGSGIFAAAEAAPFADIWGNNAVLAYVPAGADGQTYAPGTGGLNREEPSYGYTYVMEGHPAVEAPYLDRNTVSWIYPCTYERAPVLSGMLAGFLFQDPWAPAEEEEG